MSAYSDLRVLDLSSEVAGPFCAKLFGDFGADVVKIEPPGGERGRGLPPVFTAENGSEQSAFFLYLNTSKRGVTLDIVQPDGAELFRRLLRDADVVVESFAPGVLDALGLGYDALEEIKPGIILTSITSFGQDGPWSGLPLSDLTAYALSGWAAGNRRPGREPLKGSGYQASFQAGIAAFIATAGAIVYRDRAGFGQQVDVSMLEPTVASFAPAILTAQYNGEPAKPRPAGFQSGPAPAADGYFSLTLSRAHFWRDAMNALGLHDLATDPRYESSGYRNANAEEVATLVEPRLAARGKQELFDMMSLLRVVSGMVLDVNELFENPHLAARGFLVEAQHPEAGTLRYPGAPFKLSETPWQMSRPAPGLGEHAGEVLAAAGVSDVELARLRERGIV